MRYFFYIAILIAIITIVSCNQFDQTSAPVNHQDDNNTELNDMHFHHYIVNIDEIRSIIKHNSPAKTKQVGKIQSNTIIVPKDAVSIQDALDAASSGNTILVQKGTYNEDIEVYTDGLTIRAVGEVKLEGTFYVSADNVSMDGFEIASPADGIGISLDGSSNTEIKNCVVYGAYYGILLMECEYFSIKNNTLKNNVTFGALIVNSSHGSINNNIANNNRIGLSAQYSSEYTEFKGNKSYNNNIGIMFSDCSNSIIKANTAKENYKAGIVLNAGSANNEVAENISLDNMATGILLYTAKSNLVQSNQSKSNAGIGIWINSSDNNIIKTNTAKNNIPCDIVNEGTNNTFINNTADCTQGF